MKLAMHLHMPHVCFGRDVSRSGPPVVTMHGLKGMCELRRPWWPCAVQADPRNYSLRLRYCLQHSSRFVAWHTGLDRQSLGYQKPLTNFLSQLMQQCHTPLAALPNTASGRITPASAGLLLLHTFEAPCPLLRSLHHLH